MPTEATIGDKIVDALSSNEALSNNKKFGLFVVQVQVQVHLFTLIQLQYNNIKEKKKR